MTVARSPDKRRPKYGEASHQKAALDSDTKAAYLILSFGVIFILFGLKNLVSNPTLGLDSLAAMAVMFGGVLSGVAVMVGRHQAVLSP